MKFIKFFLSMLLGVGILFYGVVQAGIRFGGKKSEVVAGVEGILNIKAPALHVKEGTINKVQRGTLKGSNIYFENGFFNTGLSESSINGVFDPKFKGESIEGIQEFGRIELSQRGTEFDAADYFFTNPGGVLQQVLVKSGTSLMRGQPLFFGKNDIQLEGIDSTLAIGIQNTLNSSITLNGGILYLQNDLSLGDDAVLIGDGQVVFNNRRLSLGGTASIWTGNLLWNNALDLQLNSRVGVEGIWQFYSDCQINGNGNVIDLANNGIFLIYPGSRLRLTGVVLKGLGTGKIIMGYGAELYLSNVTIEMNDNVEFYSGGIYVDGPTELIDKDKMLTFRSTTTNDWVLRGNGHGAFEWSPGFDTCASLTIDRVALTYDPLEFIDKFNIRPLRIQDPSHKYINIINNGSIRKFRMESISFLDYSSDAAMQRYAVVMPARPIKIFPVVNSNGVLNYDFTVSGGSNFYRFTRAHGALMFVVDGVHVVYEDLLFSEFSPEYLSLGQDSSIVFGNNCTIELFRNDVLNDVWTFQGNAILRGRGTTLTLGPTGKIVLQGENSSLLFEGITLKDVSGDNIQCTENSSKFIFNGVKWIQSGEFILNKGSFDVLGDFTIIGPQIFTYVSDQVSNILADATLFLKRDAELYFVPVGVGGRNRLQFADDSATLYMENATLSAPAPGLQLTTGYLELSKFNYLNNDGGTDASTGIVFGDGTIAHNLYIDQPSSDALRTLSGVLTIQNVAV